MLVSAFRMLSLLKQRRAMSFTCGVNVRDGSRVTPRILGVFTSGSVVLWRLTCGWAWNCLVQGVNKVTEDFAEEICRWFLSAHSTMGGKDPFRRSAS